MDSDNARLDATDWAILSALQDDGRLSNADLARHVALSPSGTAERVRRLVEAEVITGFHAAVDPRKVGYGLTAVIRLRHERAGSKAMKDALQRPEVISCYHMTGEDCYLAFVHVPSMRHLEEVAGRFSMAGEATTSLVFSTAVAPRALAPPPD